MRMCVGITSAWVITLMCFMCTRSVCLPQVMAPQSICIPQYVQPGPSNHASIILYGTVRAPQIYVTWILLICLIFF